MRESVETAASTTPITAVLEPITAWANRPDVSPGGFFA
jgi:hypothetical protein